MSEKLELLRKKYIHYLDRKARHVAYALNEKKVVSKLILSYIKNLYKVANLEKKYNNLGFESAYHNPISSEFEFLVARILYYYSKNKKLKWKIFLRKQKGKTAPDIRLTKKNKTIAIIELKAKAGWIQPFFSLERYKKDLGNPRLDNNNSDPRKLIKKIKKQIKKYSKEFKISKNRIYFLLPTLALVHRIKYKSKIHDYYTNFSKNSGLSRNNLILLSNNLNLDLASKHSYKKINYSPTTDFENFIKEIRCL